MTNLTVNVKIGLLCSRIKKSNKKHCKHYLKINTVNKNHYVSFFPCHFGIIVLNFREGSANKNTKAEIR